MEIDCLNSRVWRTGSRLVALLLVLLSANLASANRERTPPILRGVRKIVFLGDSITQAGDYVVDIDCWLLAHGYRESVLNIGLASETATDLTPAENEWHRKTFGFGRPFVSERLMRALDVTKPDLLVACYGMNDSTGLPSTDEGLKRYEEAIAKLRDTALRSGAKKVLICTPPIFDNKGSYGDNKQDQVLARYSDWLVSKRKDGWLVADIHTPMRKALDDRRSADPKFQFAGDGVHPDRAGHWVIAQSILNDGFQAHLDKVASAEALFPQRGQEIRDLVRKQQDVLFSSYMTKVTHGRPGVPGGPGATPGPSIEESERQASEFESQIEALLK